jgi:prepilin-type processing-associated H-X9-DG protein/prepilin-type N-terminal cleavage/methylation domain-containing protein
MTPDTRACVLTHHPHRFLTRFRLRQADSSEIMLGHKDLDICRAPPRDAAVTRTHSSPHTTHAFTIDTRSTVTRHRCGFTIVELLVVIGIIASLVGIAFPVLQIARESARRSACSNNLKQVALAFATYSDANKTLPGWRNVVQPFSTNRAQINPTQASVSWTVPLLPHLEQETLHRWYTSSQAGSQTDPSPPVALIPSFRCLSHGNATSPAPLSYAVNGGSGAETLDDSKTPAAQFISDGIFSDAVGNISGTPMFEPNRRPYAAASALVQNLASDGSNQTILVTERSGPAVPTDIAWSAHPLVPGRNRGAMSANHSVLHPLPIGSGWRTEIQVINPTADTRPSPSPIPGNADIDDWPVRYPSSRHPSAVNAAFADGHVRILRNGIDAWVYCQLLSSNSTSVSAGVDDWQKCFDDAGVLVPYTFRADDLTR